MKLSIIVPCKNEEGNVINLYKSLNSVLKKIKYEAIFIDDGSTDNTLSRLKELYESDVSHVKVISFSRNFRKEAAIYAGLTHATGEYTCIIDGDLQQNPNYLLDMMKVLDEEKEYDEVAMVMSERTAESGFMAFCKNAFYNTMNKLCDVKLENAASDFRMFRKNVKDAVLSLAEKNRFSKGIFAWIGFNVKYLPYKVEERASGSTKFGFMSSMKYAMEGIIAFSDKPLKWPLITVFIALFIDFIYFLVLLISVLVDSAEWYMSNTIFIVMLLLFGLLFIFMGINGVYLASMNKEIKNRPVYLIKEKIGFNDETIL